MQLKIYQGIQEQEKDGLQEIEKLIKKEELATVALKKDILSQNESVKQRLAERRRSLAPRT